MAADFESDGATTTVSVDGSVSIPDSPQGTPNADWTLVLDEKLQQGVADIVNEACSDAGMYNPHRRQETPGLLHFVGCDVSALSETSKNGVSNDIALYLNGKVEVPAAAVNQYARQGRKLDAIKRLAAAASAMAIVISLFLDRVVVETYDIPLSVAQDAFDGVTSWPQPTPTTTTTTTSSTEPCPLCTGNSCPTINPDDDQGQEGTPPVTVFPSKPTSRICTEYANPDIHSCAGCSCSQGSQTGLYSLSDGAYATSVTDGSPVTYTDHCMGHTTFPVASLTKEGVCDAPSTTSSYSWVNYCYYINAPKGDHRGDRGYCVCPGDMPHYPSTSTRTTTDKWKSLTLTTTDSCGGYTGLPDSSNLISSAATTSAGSSYMGGNLPAPVTVSSAYCTPTPTAGWDSRLYKDCIKDTSRTFASNQKKLSNTGDQTAILFPFHLWSWPYQNINMIALAQFVPEACETVNMVPPADGITLGKDISEKRISEIFGKVSNDCGMAQSRRVYMDNYRDYVYGGGGYEKCIYLQILSAEHVDLQKYNVQSLSNYWPPRPRRKERSGASGIDCGESCSLRLI